MNICTKEPEEEQYFESASEDNGGTFMDISPLQRQPRKKLIYKDLNRTDETENELSRDSVARRQYPRKILRENKCSAENKEWYSKDATPLRRSPRKLENKTSEGNKNGPGNTELLLKSFPSVHVKPEVVRTATAAARRSNKPGYTLCYKLLLGVFSEETIANSRGHGINKPKEGETRPPLDKEQVEAIKEFSIKWCKKNEKPVPLMSELDNAITEQVSHCRKILKKKLSKK